ncbi:MAG: hypothetical protein AVDCRST_MAG37-3572, partial [uncultured Rubrobacteraceae bacterium]
AAQRVTEAEAARLDEVEGHQADLRVLRRERLGRGRDDLLARADARGGAGRRVSRPDGTAHLHQLQLCDDLRRRSDRAPV